MADDQELERCRHDVREWTVGELRQALDGLPDGMRLRIDVPAAPRTNDPQISDQELVLAAAFVDDGDHLVRDELVLWADFGAGWYMRPRVES
ncbi:DUF6225 family protein [Sphaerisporangium rufum]|uniref:DUF6225 family protein n=1 Tax=Sphaerisporangium rufum TaxID=1381558 RepID=UPI00194DF953|nr:DUF6225 family protein [Sphaerisporangium rufum]